MARYLTLTEDDLDREHLCCALGDPKHARGVERKKAWMRERLPEGLVFRKLDARGKAFIEYMPGEKAWRPIVADGWLVIHCLWVSGQLAGHGHARALLTSCLEDAKRQKRHGVAVAAARTKRAFLSDPKFFARHGFVETDRAGEFVVLARRLREGGPDPRFHPAVREPPRSTPGCFVGRYTDQCPFNAHWAGEVEAALHAHGQKAKVVPLRALEEARAVPSPLGAYGLDRDGRLVSHHLLTPGAVGRLLEKLDGDR